MEAGGQHVQRGEERHLQPHEPGLAVRVVQSDAVVKRLWKQGDSMFRGEKNGTCSHMSRGWQSEWFSRTQSSNVCGNRGTACSEGRRRHLQPHEPGLAVRVVQSDAVVKRLWKQGTTRSEDGMRGGNITDTYGIVGALYCEHWEKNFMLLRYKDKE